MRRLFHLVTLSRPTTDDVIPFLLSLSLSLSHPRVSLCDGRAVANKTVDEVGRPISGRADRLFLILARMNIFYCSFFPIVICILSLTSPLYLSLSLSHSLSSIRVLSRVFAVKAMSSFTVRAIVLSWIRPIEKYDPRVYLISASRREFFSLARDHLHVEFRDMCVHTSFSLFYFLFFSAPPL